MAASDMGSYTMAAEAAAEIVLQKLEILLSHPVRLGCLSTETLPKAAKEKLAMIQEFFSTQDRPSKSTEWLGRLLRVMYDAEEFIDKFHLREACRRHKALHMATRPLVDLISKYMLCRDLSNLVKTMKELCQDQYLRRKETEGVRKGEPASCSSHASDHWQGKKLGRLTTFWDRQASMNFVWRRDEKEKIMEQIKEEREEQWDVHRISILGEQGIGKTFLARWVYREVMDLDPDLGFDYCVWVDVSADMDMQEFLFEILKQVSKLKRDVKDFDLNEIMDILYNKLAMAKKFLIVLDGVQPSHEQLFQTLVTIIPTPTKGCIITTTRDDGIAEMMSSCKDPIVLKDFGQDKIQKMLARKLHGVHDADRLTNEEKDIIKRCRGLPLCISLLGGLLSNAGDHVRIALPNDGSMMTLLDILQLSYHRLPNHLKPCFIYMALFPVASLIPTRRLVRLWLAEGLLDLHCYDREGTTTRSPEDVGETFILELASRNMIDVVSWRADGSPKACQMLTSLYEMIRRAAMRTGFFHIHSTSKSKDRIDGDPTGQAQPQERTKIRWLAEHTNIVTDDRGGSYPNLNLSHVRSFLSFYPRRGMLTKDISTFLGKMTFETGYNLLRVLDLEGVYKPSLQGVLHKLVLLRYLGLRSTVLDSIPSAVADLQHLETLDIKHTNITSLPSSLWKARNLRHLHLNWFYIDLKNILKACRNDAMALTKLQTLSGLVIGEVKENLMAEPMDSLTTITKLKLFLQRSGTDTSGVVGQTIANWISSRLTNLQSLTFGVIQEAEPGTSQMGPLPKLSLAEQHHYLLELYLLGQLNKPSWTQLLPGSLRVLSLSGSKLEIDMMPELGGLLRNLRTFRLLANSFQGTSLTFIKDGFPSLNILKIWKLPELETVIIEQGAMPHLKELEFRRLDVLKNVQGIKECHELENICVVVKKGATGLVEHLKDKIGRATTSQYQREDTKMPESKDDDENDRDEKGEIFYLHVEKKRHVDDDDDRDEKRDMLDVPVEREEA